MELIIQEDYSRNKIDIYIKSRENSRIIIYGYDGEFIIRTDVTEPVVKEVKPLLSLPGDLFSTLMTLMVNEAHKRNIRTENENHLKGKLEATEKHLSDMQKAFEKLLSLQKK